MDLAADQQFALNEAGQPATFSLDGVTVKTVTAIFDQSVEIYSPGQADTTEFKPAITVASSDMDGISKTHTVTISGKEYKIYLEPEPDGHGLTRIVLVAKK
jgi:hypothetical protein